ncbi:hypothetical protein [Myceligenerans halotolerans]
MGAVAIIGWVRTALTGRETNLIVVAAVAVSSAIVMSALVVLNGPWTNEELSKQTDGKPWMALYWLLYCGAAGLASAMFGLSSARASRKLGLGYGWGMLIAAVGAACGLAWAAVSLVIHVLVNTALWESALGVTASALITTATAFLCVGAVGHLILAMVRKHHRQADVRALHNHLVATVSEIRLESDQVLAEYHTMVEVMDALAVLSRYSSESDVEHVRTAVGDAPREVHLAYQIDIAAARRAIGDTPEHSDDWSSWLSDDEAVYRLGRAFRDRTTSSARQRVVEQVVGE